MAAKPASDSRRARPRDPLNPPSDPPSTITAPADGLSDVAAKYSATRPASRMTTVAGRGAGAAATGAGGVWAVAGPVRRKAPNRTAATAAGRLADRAMDIMFSVREEL